MVLKVKDSGYIRTLKDNEKSNYFLKALKFAYEESEEKEHCAFNHWLDYLLNNVLFEEDMNTIYKIWCTPNEKD